LPVILPLTSRAGGTVVLTPEDLGATETSVTVASSPSSSPVIL